MYIRDLLALQREFATRPGTGIAAHVHACSARWLRVQQAGVVLAAANLEMLRVQPPQRDAATGVAPLREAARDFNLLAGLLLHQFNRQRTPHQCIDALDTLCALRHTP
ncbi:hypothetical protein [Burkholderia metallica]|uniref:hypothetical protein n=1 Tax=Burkholderia metallica TaxID=488729 RepID=UPI001CF35263|nr:hypothetical protein [Burkholderia metallica]MCA8023434.1 hypothetical protein [Burkholderia metallica]